MEPSDSLVLPSPTDLTPHQLDFLNDRFTSAQHLLSTSSDLSSQLAKACSDYDRDLVSLRKKLVKLTVSWIYRSIVAKSSIQDASVKLENLCLLTSSPPAKGNVKVFGDEFPMLVNEVQRIEDIRLYVDTALRLEVLVGELEDSASLINHHQRWNILVEMVSHNTVPRGAGFKLEKLLHAIKVINEIEDILVGLAMSWPQWCHLSGSVDNRVDKTLAVLRPKIIADHRSLLVSLGWPPKLTTSASEGREISCAIPNPLVLMQVDKRESYTHSFLALCALQHLQARRDDRRQNNSDKKQKMMRLWAIDELVSPISTRMEFHFAKWIHEPELIFALVFKITRDFMVGVEEVLQPLMDQARLISFSAREAWIHSMVEMLSGFLEKKIFSHLLEGYKEESVKTEIMSSWLNLVDLMVSLNKKMLSLAKLETSQFMRYDTVFGPSGGISLLGLFCERHDWLKIWAKMEFRDAWRKLKLELKSDKAWILDDCKGIDLIKDTETDGYTFATRQEHKAPPISKSVLKIMWGLIERCQTLPSVSPRLKFIRSTARKLLWCFLNVLITHCRIEDLRHESFDHDHTIARVCGSINTARYVENRLQQWSDDLDFLDMMVAGNNLEYPQIVEVDDSIFFGEEIRSLAELETNWLVEMIGAVLRQFEMLSWEYIRKKEIFGPHDTSTVEETVSIVSPDLIPALDALQGNLHSIHEILNMKDFVDLWRSIADGLDHFLFQSILAANNEISRRGIDQLIVDMGALHHVFQPFCARPEAFFPCVRDSLKVLNMGKEEVRRFQVALVFSPENGMNCLRRFEISQLSLNHVTILLKIHDRHGR